MDGGGGDDGGFQKAAGREEAQVLAVGGDEAGGVCDGLRNTTVAPAGASTLARATFSAVPPSTNQYRT